MTTEARILINRLEAKDTQRSNIERDDPIFKDSVKTVEALMNTQAGLVRVLEAALKTAKFEKQVFRPWHTEAEDLINKIKAGDRID